MASQFVKLPVSGGSGPGAGVDSFNGRSGVVVSQAGDYGASLISNVPAGNIAATNVQAAIDELDAEKQAAITGNNSRLIIKNSSGDVESDETLQKNSVGGVQQQAVDEVVDSASHSFNTVNIALEPQENAPDTSVTLCSNSLVVDPNDSGFDIATNNGNLTLHNNFVEHESSADIGQVVFTNNYTEIGNGTDPIDVRGLAYQFGFGEVRSGVTLTGSVQGYGFQPNVRSGATIDQANSFTQAFYDNMTYEVPSAFHTSFNAAPTIDEVSDTKSYTGLNVNPTIDTFDGNAGFQGVNISGTLGTFNEDGYFQGVNVNPNITSARYAAGLQVTMDNVTPYAGVSSTLTEQDLTFTFNNPESGTNAFTLEYTPGATAGSEVVSLSGSDIVVQIEDGVSTASQIKTAMEAVPQIAANLTITISGVGSNPQDVFGPVNFSGGEDPGDVRAAFLDGDVEITGSLTFGGALSIGKLNAFATQAVISGTGNPASIHNLISNPTIGNSQTVTLGDTIGLNTAMLLTVGTNSTVTSALVGLSALALPAVVNLGSGSTVDRVAGATFAISLDVGAAGTITNLDLCRAVGLPNGTTTVTNLKGFAMDLPFGDPGTTTWGFYESPGVNNYFAGNLLIGGTAGSDDTVTNDSVALEIKSVSKALVTSRMTTTQRDALTAIQGMVVFNTSTSKLQVYDGTSWADLH